MMAAIGQERTLIGSEMYGSLATSTSVQGNSRFGGDSFPDIELLLHESRKLFWRRSFCFEALAGKLSPYIGDLQDEV